MARPTNSTIADLQPSDSPVMGFSDEQLPDGLIEVGEVKGGLVTGLSQEKTPRGSASVFINGRILPGWTETRPGTTLLTPTKPDNNKIYKLILCLNEAGSPIVARFALGSIYLLIDNVWYSVDDFITLTPYEANKDGNGWWLFTTPIGSGDTFTKILPSRDQLLAGDAALNAVQVIAKNTDGFLLIVNPLYVTHPVLNVTQMFNYLFVTDLLGPVGWVSLDALAHDERAASGRIRGAPQARYITTFGDRVIAAHIESGGDGFPNRVQWCDNSDPFTWDGETSGTEDLIQGAFGLSDSITGIFGMDQICYILRRQSIWTMTRQAFGSVPFRFDPYLSGYGCDLPYSATQIQNGLIWADRRTKGVYMFIPGSLPIRISENINPNFIVDLEDPIWVEGSYDPFERQYHLGLTTSGVDYLIQKIYIYDLDSKTWAVDDSPIISCFGRMAGTLDIQDRLIFHSSIFKGIETGEIIYHDEDVNTDWNGDEITLTFASPNMGALSNRRTLQYVLTKLLVLFDGDVIFDVSNDGVTWRNVITKSVTSETYLQQVGLKKQPITGDDLFWRLRSTAKIQLRSWFAELLDKSMSR